MPSLQEALTNNKVKTGSTGKLRYNDLAPTVTADNVTNTFTTSTVDPSIQTTAIAESLRGKVTDPDAVAEQLATVKTEEEAAAVLNANGADASLLNDLLPFILGGAGLAVGGLALKEVLAKRKKSKPTIGGAKNDPPHGPGANGSDSSIVKARVTNKKPSTVDGRVIEGKVTRITDGTASVQPKQITTDIMSDDKAMTDLQRVLMNMGKVGQRKGKIK